MKIFALRPLNFLKATRLQRLRQNLSNFVSFELEYCSFFQIDQNYNRFLFLMMKIAQSNLGDSMYRVVELCEKREGSLVMSDGKILAKKGGGRKVLGWGQKIRFGGGGIFFRGERFLKGAKTFFRGAIYLFINFFLGGGE